MPSAPNTDDNGTDQPDTDPSTQPGTADSSDETSTALDTGEAEDGADRDATEPSEAATGTSEADPFPPRGTLTLRALRWAGLLGAVVFGSTALVLSRELTEASSTIPDKASTLMWCMFFGGLLVWPFFNFRENKGPILTTIVTTVMAALGMTTSCISDSGMVGHLSGDRILRPVPPGPGWSDALSHALPERRHTVALPAHAHHPGRYRGSQ